MMEAAEDSLDWFPRTTTDIGHSIICLAGEVGEIANNYKKIQRDPSRGRDYAGQPLLYTEESTLLGEEVVDVLVYCFKLAAQLGLDLERMYDDKRKHNAERFGKH